MSQPVSLDCASAADIPSAGQLRQLVTQEHHVVLRFPAGRDIVSQSCMVLRLGSLLPEFAVFDSSSSYDAPQITIKKVIAAEEVRANEAEFVAALRLFRQIATTLANRLAGHLGVSADHLLRAGFGTEQTGWADRLRGLLGRRFRGNRLDREWTYCFHGEACRFENRMTGQVVEVRLGFGTDFGVLDPYFFALFVKSTPRLTHLAPLLRDDFHDAKRVLELLHRAGHLRVMQQGHQSGLTLREGGDQPGEGMPPGAPGADATTENDWDSCSEPMEMFRYLGGHPSDRKFRLFLCAWCRYLWDRIPDEQCRRAVETGERFADQLANDREREGAFWLARDAAWNHITGQLGEYRSAVRSPWDVVVRTVADGSSRVLERDITQSAADDAEKGHQCHLLRDIFGPFPFRDVRITPSILTWNDGLIVKLAQSAYEQRNLPEGTLDDSRLAILADALEEAGCTETDLLEHLRGPGPHVRGCFALDLLLGRK